MLSNSQLLSSRCISTLLKESFLAIKQSARLIDGGKLTFLVCAGLLYSQVVNTPQTGQCGFLQTDSVSFQRPAQPSNSLANITGVLIQAIFQHLEVASAARLASTCKVCFDEHRHACADIYERAYQQLTPEVTYQFFYTRDWQLGVAIIVHWADEELLLQMYRIALHRKALQEFWTSVWPANLHESIWTAAMTIGQHDTLADYCKDYPMPEFLWIKAVVSCKQWKSPLLDAWVHDDLLEKAAMESMGSVWEHGSVILFVAQQAVHTNGGVGLNGDAFCYAIIMEDADSSADVLEDNYSDWGGDPVFVWDSTVDWMHQAPSEQKYTYVEPDQIFPCEPIGLLRRREYMRKPSSVRSRQCRANKQADNRIKQPRMRLDKHGTGKHKRVGLVQWEVMLDHDVFE